MKPHPPGPFSAIKDFRKMLKDGRADYDNIVAARNALAAKAEAAGGIEALEVRDRIHLKFALKLEELLPGRIALYRDKHVKMSFGIVPPVVWALTHIKPLRNFYDKRMQGVYESCAKTDLSMSFRRSFERSVADTEKRQQADGERAKARAARDEEERLQRELENAAVLDAPLKIGRPVTLKIPAA
jgi:hypothetical protein